MKIALFIKDEKIDGAYADTIPIIVLHIDNKSIREVEKDFIVRKDVNYLALWLITKRIKEVYVVDIDPMVKRLFEKLGVAVKNYKDIERNPLLRRYIE